MQAPDRLKLSPVQAEDVLAALGAECPMGAETGDLFRRLVIREEGVESFQWHPQKLADRVQTTILHPDLTLEVWKDSVKREDFVTTMALEPVRARLDGLASIWGASGSAADRDRRARRALAREPARRAHVRLIKRHLPPMDDACQWEVVSGPGYDDQAVPVFDQVFASVPLAIRAVHDRHEEIVKTLEIEEAEAARLADGSGHAVDWDNDGQVPKDALVLIQPVFLNQDVEVKLRATPRSRPSSLAERAGR